MRTLFMDLFNAEYFSREFLHAIFADVSMFWQGFNSVLTPFGWNIVNN